MFSLYSSITIAFCLIIVSTACGLLPNPKNESMSSQEQAEVYMQMGSRYLEMNMLELAKENLEKSERLDNNNAEIYNVYGAFYERIKDYVNAENKYQTAVKKAPDNFIIKTNYGRFLCSRNNFDSGMRILMEALELPMNNKQWYSLTAIGVCYYKQENLVQAEDNLRKALLLKVDFSPALQEMQKISYQNHQYLSARAFLERYLAVANQTPQTLWIGFQTERALGNAKLAEDYAEQLINNFPTAAEAEAIKPLLGK